MSKPAATISPNLLDRAIAAVHPEAGLRRLRARANMVLAEKGLDLMASMPVKSTGGSRQGTLSNWNPFRHSRYSESAERKTIQDRAEDLVANDPYAAGTVESMAVNVIGTGIRPQAKPNIKRLGISEEQADAYTASAEWAWKLWAREADASSCCTFADILFVNFRSILTYGEFLNLQVTVDEPGRIFSTALQRVAPNRLRTPADLMSDITIREGVVLGGRGQPVSYWIADPDDGIMLRLTSKDFQNLPARRAHRNVVYHRFFHRDPEQVRGKSILAPGMKSFRDLGDYLDFELVANIVTASFPVFIATDNPEGIPGAEMLNGPKAEAGRSYSEYEPGQVMYGRQGERPYVLESNRPGNNFGTFVERVLRGLSAATNMPYEVLAKDFSKTNYSSARAALLEAWRVYLLYRAGMVNWFCQPVYEQIMEEAYLRGMLEIPAGAPDFYEAKAEWCNAMWIGAARGHVDPVKEMAANKVALDENITTLSQIVSEQGGDDWEATMEQRSREVKKAAELGITPAQVAGAVPPDMPQEREQ